jgi:hypothetical protein
MIIVEGCDNTGKTTLIGALIKEFPELQATRSAGPVSLGKQLAWFARAIRNEDPRMVYDRFSPIVEQVYGPILRNGSIFGTYWYDLFTLTLRREPLIIYCRPPFSTVCRFGDREQMKGVREHVSDLYSRYDFVMGNLHDMYMRSGRYHVYDYTEHGATDEIISAVEVYLKTHRMILPRRT